MQHQRRILHFDDINQSHEAMGFAGRTDLPDFHVYTLEETYPSTRKLMPPYTLRFYCVMLLEEPPNWKALVSSSTRSVQA